MNNTSGFGLTLAIATAVLITLTSPAAADYVTTVMGDGPIGYWRLGESAGPTAVDSSPSAANLDYTLFPAGDFGQPGGIVGDADTAVKFTPAPLPNAPLGSPSTHPTIVSPNTTDFGFASGGSFSLEYWLKVAPGNASANDAGVIVKGYDSAQARPWYLTRYRPNVGGGTVDFFLRDPGGANSATNSSTNLTDDQWHHVVGVYDSAVAEVQIFVDGVQEGSRGGVPAAAYGTNDRPFTIGNHFNRGFDGLLDEVAVYDSALDAVQVATHYFEGSGTSPDPLLNIDFGSSANSGGGPGGGQRGFYGFEASEGDGTADVTRTFPSSLGTADAVDVTIGGFTHFRDYAGLIDGSDAISPLLSDMVLRNSADTMTVRLDGLKPGAYQMTTYHHSTQFGGGSLDIGLHDAQGNSTIATALGVSGGTSPALGTSSTFEFVSDGSSVSVDFIGGTSSQHMPMNGFRLKEAPTGPARLDVVLAVDFNDRGAAEATDPTVTQPGFSEFLIGGVENVDQVDPTTRTINGVDVTLVHSNGLGVGDRRRAYPLPGALYSASEIQRDLLFARTTPAGDGGASTNDGLDILIENLDALTLYEVEIWSYDDGSNSPRKSDWWANGVLKMDDYTFNGADTNPLTGLPFDDHAAFSFLTTSDSAGAILIEARQAYAGTEIGVFLNGMRVSTVVPEPGTLALLAFGAMALVPLWLRRRRA